MSEAGRDLSAELFGGGGRTSVETWRQTLRLDELEQQHALPSGLMTSVLRQESGGDPRVKSSAGAQGLFQFMPATAAQYQIDPFDPQQAAPAAAKELSTLYKKYGGDVDRTLAAWNWGQGNVDRKGMASMPAETRGFLTNVKHFLRPGVAEAATKAPTGGRDLSQELFGTTAPTGGRDLTQEILPAEAPRSPQTPQADIASPAAAAQAIARLRAQQPPVAPGRSTDPAALLAGGSGQGGTPQPVTDPAARLAVGGGPAAPSREQQLLADARARQQRGETQAVPLPPGVPSVEQETLEEGITAPSTMIPLLMPGAGAVAVTPLLTKAGPLITRGARAAAEGLSQTLGWTTGRTAETGQVPSAGEIGTEAALNIATGGVVEVPGVLRDVKRAALRSTPGAQTLLKEQAVREAEGLGPRVFGAQDKAVVGQMFDDVAASGVKLDVTPVQDLWTSLTAAERRVAGNELKKISSTFADALQRPGLKGWDIGELQHLRSELRKASLARKTPETQDLLQAMRSAVDEAIVGGMAVGSRAAGTAPEVLREAQAAWRRVRASEDLQGLITKHTRDSPNLKWQELNLAALNKELRGGGTNAAKNLVGQMGDVERQALQQELESLARHYPFVRVTDTGAKWTGRGSLLAAGGLAVTGNLPAAAAALLPAMVAAASRSPTVMSLFRRSIIEGKGRLSPHHVDAILNAIRHEQAGETPSGTGQ